MTDPTDRYPILARIPADERPVWVTQAEAGKPLTPEQAARLGRPHLAGALLVPRDGILGSVAFDTVFTPEHQQTLLDQLARLTRQALMERAS